MDFRRSFWLLVFYTALVFLCITTAVRISFEYNPLSIRSKNKILETFEQNEMVLIGDSSLAAGIDEQYLSSLTGLTISRLNLSATGHNFAATYNLIRHAITNNENLQYIVIMQSPSAWQYGFQQAGYCSTLGTLDSKSVINAGLIDRWTCLKLKHLSIAQIYSTLAQRIYEYIFNEKITYIATYKNGGLNISKDLSQNKFKGLENINSDKYKIIALINDLQIKGFPKILYLQGALHSELHKKYLTHIERHHNIINSYQNIQLVESYLYPKNENMGNSENHVDTSFQRQATDFYFKALKSHLKKPVSK